MNDERDYRPANSKDFAGAARRLDPADLRTDRVEDDAGYAGRRDVAPAYVEAPGTGAGYRTSPDDSGYRTSAPAFGVAEPTTRTDVGTLGRERVVTEDAAPEPRPFSIVAGFFGWAVASFFTLVFATIVLALLGASAYDATDGGATGLTEDTFNALTTGGLVALLLSLFLAYLLGGYAAGRIGLWHGTGQGVAVVAWSVLFTIVTLALGAALGDAVAGLSLVPVIDWTALTGPTIVGLLLALAAMLGGAILGANFGTRPYGIDRPFRRRAWRGRPL